MEQPPHFGGNAGEPVSQVDPDDLKAIWTFMEDSPANAAFATGVGLLQRVCKPGADIEALSYRAMMLNVLTRHAGEQLAPWSEDGRLDDQVFRAAARIQMKWMGVGIVRQGLPFDVNEFVRLCGQQT